MDFSNGLGDEMEASLEAFAREADAILDESHEFDDTFTYQSQHDSSATFDPRTQSQSLEKPFTSSFPFSQIPASTSSTSHNALATSHSRSTTPKSQPGSNSKYRCHCGYEPNGEERWKASNYARHLRTQHSQDNGRKWRCGWRGCTSEFTRSDNLRSHQRDKGHDNLADLGLSFEESNAEMGMGMLMSGRENMEKSRDDRARPPKKRRTSEEKGIELR
jgi:hypothetical protein